MWTITIRDPEEGITRGYTSSDKKISSFSNGYGMTQGRGMLPPGVYIEETSCYPCYKKEDGAMSLLFGWYNSREGFLISDSREITDGVGISDTAQKILAFEEHGLILGFTGQYTYGKVHVRDILKERLKKTDNPIRCIDDTMTQLQKGIVGCDFLNLQVIHAVGGKLEYILYDNSNMFSERKIIGVSTYCATSGIGWLGSDAKFIDDMEKALEYSVNRLKLDIEFRNKMEYVPRIGGKVQGYRIFSDGKIQKMQL